MSELRACQQNNVECGYAKLEAERDALKAQLVAMTLEHDMRRMAEKRNSELIQERDALAERVVEVLELLKAHHEDRLRYTLAKRRANATCGEFKINALSELADSVYMAVLGNQTEQALSTPDDSAAILARRDARTILECAELSPNDLNTSAGDSPAEVWIKFRDALRAPHAKITEQAAEIERLNDELAKVYVKGSFNYGKFIGSLEQADRIKALEAEVERQSKVIKLGKEAMTWDVGGEPLPTLEVEALAAIAELEKGVG